MGLLWHLINVGYSPVSLQRFSVPLWHTTGVNREPPDSYSVVIPKLCIAPCLVVPFKQPRCTGKTRCLGQSNIAGWHCVASWISVTLWKNTMLSCLVLPVCTQRSPTALLSLVSRAWKRNVKAPD